MTLYIEKSNIENAGAGLFSNKYFKKGEIICEYTGDIIDKFCYNDRIFTINANKHIIGNGLAAYANDCVYFGKLNYEQTNDIFEKKVLPLINGLNYNAKYDIIDDKAYVVAITDININDEIYVPYGLNYWFFRFIKANYLDRSYVMQLGK